MSMPQYRHYLALLDLFKLKPSKESKEFGDLAMFMAQVCARYIPPLACSGVRNRIWAAGWKATQGSVVPA